MRSASELAKLMVKPGDAEAFERCIATDGAVILRVLRTKADKESEMLFNSGVENETDSKTAKRVSFIQGLRWLEQAIIKANKQQEQVQ